MELPFSSSFFFVAVHMLPAKSLCGSEGKVLRVSGGTPVPVR